VQPTSQKLLEDRLTEWFPLVPRPRPYCRSLTHRVEEIQHLAESAAVDDSTETRISTAAETHNKAALLLSDCGLDDLADRLCWQQFDLFHAARPLPLRAAKLALQPVVNLGRLLIRTGHHDRAYDLFQNLFTAVRNQTTTTLDGRPVDFSHFVNQLEHLKDIGQFLWAVLLADGTRALTRAGRWHDALQHLNHQKGIGKRMLDGRQVAILERHYAGDHTTARNLVDDSAVSEPWEQAIAAFLRALCTNAIEQRDEASVTGVVDVLLNLEPTPAHPAFRIRLGLCVLDLAPTGKAPHLATWITREALATTDAYTARDVLSHDMCCMNMSEQRRTTLAAIVQESGLNRGTMPADSLDKLMAAVSTSETQLAAGLRSR
jgi:hypothetical protein